MRLQIYKFIMMSYLTPNISNRWFNCIKKRHILSSLKGLLPKNITFMTLIQYQVIWITSQFRLDTLWKILFYYMSILWVKNDMSYFCTKYYLTSIVLDLCQLEPCLNGGICSDKITGRCWSCNGGYFGSKCEKNCKSSKLNILLINQ